MNAANTNPAAAKITAELAGILGVDQKDNDKPQPEKTPKKRAAKQPPRKKAEAPQVGEGSTWEQVNRRTTIYAPLGRRKEIQNELARRDDDRSFSRLINDLLDEWEANP